MISVPVHSVFHKNGGVSHIKGGGCYKNGAVRWNEDQYSVLISNYEKLSKKRYFELGIMK